MSSLADLWGALSPYFGQGMATGGATPVSPVVQPPQPAQANAHNPIGNIIPWTPDMTPSQGAPTPDQLAKMPFGAFSQLRDQFPSQSDQNYLAPYEHRAYVREYGSNPLEKAILGVALPAGYNVGKSAGLIGGRSQPSLEEWRQSILGAFDTPSN